MTNKPMLSVERELLESLAAYVADSPNAIMRARSVQLRALLDKPVVESEVDRLERRCKNAELALKVQTENCEALKAIQHQGEPVAWVIDTADGRGADYYPGKGLDTLELGAKLYAEQPVPVAVQVSWADVEPWYNENEQMLRDVGKFEGLKGVALEVWRAARLNGG